jgi:hypothetical protein
MAERPRQYQRRPKRVKLAAVMAAEISGITQVSKETGISPSTLHHWMNDPEMAAIRSKTREDLADEIKAVAHLAWQAVGEGLRNGTLEARDAIFAAEKATSLQILMTGGATARSEVRDITGTLADADVIDAIRAAEQATVGGGTAAEDPDPAEG